MITVTNLISENKPYFKLEIEELIFEKGKIYGIFGPNGTGKTTFLKILGGISRKYHGNIKIEGTVAYLPDKIEYFEWMNVNDVVMMYQDLFKDFQLPEFEDIMDSFTGSRKTLLKNLSKGQLEHLHLALLFARDVEIYILDEPLGGIDIINQQKILTKILNRLAGTATLIMTTHYPQGIENIFDTVIFLQAGKIIRQENVENYNQIIRDYEEVFARA